MSKQVEVRYSVEAGVATVCIDRGERRNALNWNAVEQLCRAFIKASTDDQVRVAMLTGSGDRAFSAGGDMTDMSGAERRDDGGAPPFAKLLSIMHSFPKPILGRINGDALGGGFGLVLACDVAIAAEHARFGTPEVKLGMFPWMIMPLLSAHVGPKKLAELALCGHKLDAHQALSMGLINMNVPLEELDATCQKWLRSLSKACPPVMARAMVNLRHKRYHNLPAVLAEQQDHFLWNLQQPELLEGVAAFLQKREPNWVLSTSE